MRALPRRVFELARDVTRWPDLLDHYRKVTVVSRDGPEIVADMHAVRAFGPFDIPVAWRSRTWAEAENENDLRLRFVHVGGVTKGMDVTWHITAVGDNSSRAAIEHVFSRPLALVGGEFVPALIDRLFVRAIAGRTLATFKRLAEESAP